MKLFYVYKLNYCEFTEHRGSLVAAKDWQTAKGLALNKWTDADKHNVAVKEVPMSSGIICDTDYINKIKVE